MAKYTTHITVRVSPSMRKGFLNKAKTYGDPSAVHRDLLLAFIDGRVTITEPASNDKKNLYSK